MKKSAFSTEQHSQDSITVFVPLVVPEHMRSIIDLRTVKATTQSSGALPLLPQSPFQPELLSLVSLDVDYIDIGTHSDWVCAEIPTLFIQSKDQMEQIGIVLEQLKNKIESLTNSPAEKKK